MAYSDGVFLENLHCIGSEVEGKDPCASSDACGVYEKTDLKTGKVIFDAFCRSCNQAFNVQQVANSSLGDILYEGGDKPKKRASLKPKERITVDEAKTIIKNTTFDADGYLGIESEYFEFYGHRLEKDSEGNVVKEYYPESQGGHFYGYKYRFVLPNGDKCFGRVGWTGQKSDLSGQSRFKEGGGKYILITGGEKDKVAAYKMLKEAQDRRYGEEAGFNYIPVVSPTTGESSAAIQIAAQYDFLNQYENIIIGMDNDEAGQQATQEIIKVLPKDKVKIASWSMKDPFEMLENGKSAQFLRDFYDAKDAVPQQVKTSKDADDEMEEELLREVVPLPPFMSKLQYLMAGGVPLGYWVNLIAITGGGKTTYVNEIIYHLLFNSPYKTGVLTLELNAGQYQTVLLSRHVGVKIQKIPSRQEKLEFLNKPEILTARRELRQTELGEERYTLLDEREGDLSLVKESILKMVRKFGCKVIVIDPVQDLFEGTTLEAQGAFIKFLKNLLKEGIALFCVCHVTKGTTKTDKDGKLVRRKLTEDDVAGLSSIVKSGAANVIFDRNKLEEDSVLKHVTDVILPKCRWTGDSGEAGRWYYDIDTHTAHDFETYVRDVKPEWSHYLEKSPEPKSNLSTTFKVPSPESIGVDIDIFG